MRYRGLAALTGVLGCLLLPVAAGAAQGPAGTLDFLAPPAAQASTERLALAAGDGSERVALWTATNARHEVCLGWRLGPSTSPAVALTCLHLGLERALLSVESGGGLGGIATWGVVVGLASPRVAEVSAETLYGTRTIQRLELRPIPSLPGWHVFATEVMSHPTSTQIEAFDAQGDLVAADSGASIHPATTAGSAPTPAGLPAGIPVITVPPPPIPGQTITPSGPAWSDWAADVPESVVSDRRAVSLALANPEVQSILSSHGAWLDGSAGWTNCSGRALGRVVSFRFAAAATFTATLPSVGPPAGPYSYAVTVRKVLATDWHVMSVWVDTNAGAVVGVGAVGPELPGETGNITTPIDTVVPARDAGGPDAGSSCWQSHS